VVKDVHLAVGAGEVVGLLGPNGAGKTTTFYMVVGLVRADEGEIRIDGQPIQGLPIHRRSRLGLSYLPQEASIFRKLTVAENIRAVLELQLGADGRPQAGALINELLEKLLHDLSIDKLRDSPAPALSGGERRRVEIARALATQPRFILLDEPFAGVDPIAVIEIQRIISFLRSRGIGVLITDHNVRETLGICDRAYIISEGSVLAEGTPHEIVSNEQVRKVYLGEHFSDVRAQPSVMKPSLQVRLSQHLALTPQLQQSIRLLQLSTLELHQEVGQMLDQNPFLEMEDDAPASPFETPPERQAVADRVADSDVARRAGRGRGGGRDPRRGVRHHRTRRLGKRHRGDDFDGIRETPSGASSSGSEGDDTDAQDRRRRSESLQDHLRAQIAGMRLGDDDRAALEVLIESLDGDGYLADPLLEIAERLAEMLGVSTGEAATSCWDRLSIALKWLQSLEPTGVGARSLGECLVLQLRTTPGLRGPPAGRAHLRTPPGPAGRRDMKRLTALTDADEDLVREAQALIVACEPKPGRQFSPAEGNIIVPDVIVRKTGRGISVTLNPDVMPKLRINDIYAQAARGQRGSAANPG
jgi:lipopolysaccharide export system ATP-binding protein